MPSSYLAICSYNLSFRCSHFQLSIHQIKLCSNQPLIKSSIHKGFYPLIDLAIPPYIFPTNQLLEASAFVLLEKGSLHIVMAISKQNRHNLCVFKVPIISTVLRIQILYRNWAIFLLLKTITLSTTNRSMWLCIQNFEKKNKCVKFYIGMSESK